MHTLTITLVSLLALYIVSRSKPFALLKVIGRVFSEWFTLPTRIEHTIALRCEQRRLEPFKSCPGCGRTQIRESDSICRHCKLEVSLGRGDSDHG